MTTKTAHLIFLPRNARIDTPNKTPNRKAIQKWQETAKR